MGICDTVTLDLIFFSSSLLRYEIVGVSTGTFLIPAKIRNSPCPLSHDLPANFITLAQVVGSVGSGKSSLISALIGSMVKRSGTVKVGGSIAYVAQSSWIMNDTLRENVVMGNTWDEDR